MSNNIKTIFTYQKNTIMELYEIEPGHDEKFINELNK